jgi:peptide chain release factor subunit 1
MPTDILAEQLDRLASFDSGPFPVISLYLNMQPDQHGRDHFEPFLRKELADRVGTYGPGGPERESLEKDAEKIRAYVADVDKSANGLAIFTCSAGDLFEAIPLAAPIAEHKLYISNQPHLYPLARVIDEYPRYAVLLADTNSARIFVIAANSVQQTEQVEDIKTRRHKAGGWSQARYQRHLENYHLQHAKEVVDALGRIVADEAIGSIILAGNDVIIPLLREQLPKELAEKLVDVVKLDIRAPLHAILDASITAMREKDAQTDRERVEALIGAYRGNGLATVGSEAVREALERGQVEELVIPAMPEAIKVPRAETPALPTEPGPEERMAGELIVKGRQTAARIRFIEDASLLGPVGGVGAFLRFKA